MHWLTAAAGAALVLFVLRDIFHTVGHPEGQGSLSRFVLSTTWRLSRLRGGRGRLAGPLALLAVILVWGTLAVVGWALLYWPSVPTGFVYATGSGPSPGGTNRILDALYISMVTMSTLGFGDIAPAAGWLRIANPLEAFFGFALLTVAVSWVLQIYPALNRRRVLAIRLSSLRRASVLVRLRDDNSALPPGVLERLSTDIIQALVDLSEYSETYYFPDADPNSSLAASLPYAVELARVGAASSRSDMRLAANLLTCALEDFAGVLKDRFRYSGLTMSEVFAAYAAEHGNVPADGGNHQLSGHQGE
ncbi:MAG: two pore domain potassium channel family protein [Acidimicrobiales bacterium]|nr:two pore domain potassium channel family protein [Acidimicrobiales bacterium]